MLSIVLLASLIANVVMPSVGPHSNYSFRGVHDLAELWPSECDRCYIRSAAKGEDVAEKCGSCTSDGCPAWTRGWDIHRVCLRTGPPPISERANVRNVPAWIPRGTSGCDALESALGGKKLLWLGDSVAEQFRRFLPLRCPALRGKIIQKGESEIGGLLSDIALGPGLKAGWSEKMLNVTIGADIVVLLNIGLHYADPAALRADLQHWAAALKAMRARHAVGGVVLLETTAQHFNSVTGGFLTAAAGKAPPLRGYPCVPAGYHGWDGGRSPVAYDAAGELLANPSAAPAGSRPDWRNLVLHAVAANWPLPVARLGEVTMALWDMHPGDRARGAADCTHYCYTPGLIDGIIYELASKIREPW